MRSSEKSERIVFLGQDTIKCKIVVDNKCLQHVKNFKYFGCEIWCENEKNIQQNLENFSQILRILNIIFNPLCPQIFNNKVHNPLAVPNLLYGSEIWTLRDWHYLWWNISEKQSGTPFWPQKNEEILEELKVELVDEKLRRYKSQWLRHAARMNNKKCEN